MPAQEALPRDPALQALLREARKELLDSLELQTRTLLEAIAALELRGEQERVTLDQRIGSDQRHATKARARLVGFPGLLEPSMPTSPETLDLSEASPITPRPSVATQVPEEKLLQAPDTAVEDEPERKAAEERPMAELPPRASAPCSPVQVADEPERKAAEESAGTHTEAGRNQNWCVEEIHNVRKTVENSLMLNWLGMREPDRAPTPASAYGGSVGSKRPTTWAGHLAALVRTQQFDTLCGILIMINGIIMGLQASHLASHPDDACDMAFVATDLAFNVVFLIELLLRLGTYRKQFFVGPDYMWNWLDFLVVFANMLEEAIKLAFFYGQCGGGPNFGRGAVALRIVRILRLVRILRAVRVMQLFQELRIMVCSILGCLVPLLWAILLLFIIQWSFGMYFVQTCTDHITDLTAGVGAGGFAAEEENIEELRRHWGSIWRAVYTLFQSVTGGSDWGNASDPMLAIGISPVLFHMAYIALTVFAVLNVVTGVFVENAMKTALSDQDMRVKECLDVQRDCIKNLLKIFDEVDVDGDGRISLVEFETHLQDRAVQAFLDTLGLTGVEARRLFHLLDVTGSGYVDADSFVTGCMNLRGSAKAMDVAALMLEHENFVKHVNAEMESIKSLAERRHTQSSLS